MTLSRFLRDYLYIPLGGNRKGPARRYVNLFITMLLGGLWHGANWTFVAWGAAHGAALALNHGWHAIRRGLGHDLQHSTRTGRFFAAALTFAFVTATFVIFRAETFDGSMQILRAMSGVNGVVLPEGLGAVLGAGQAWLAQLGLVFGEHVPNELTSWSKGFRFIVVLLGVAWLLPNTQQLLRDFDPAFDTYRGALDGRVPGRPLFAISPGWAVTVALLFVYTIGSLTRASEFLYFQF